VRRDEERLRDVLDAIAAIARYTAGGRQRFDDDELVRVFCLHQIEIIGEAVARLGPALLARHPAVPWREIVGMRNAIIHGYFQVDWEIVWQVVERDLGQLGQAIEKILAEGEPAPPPREPETPS
jgi:uncharacterized protein with HEPN domain